MKELEIKRILIKWLLKRPEFGSIIGSEYRFDFGARRADVVTIHEDGNACAFEIKGIGDSLRALRYQCEGYKLYFDRCFVVCERENLHLVRREIPKDIGIIVIEENIFLQLRKSKEFKKLDKIMLCSTIDTGFMRRNIKHHKLSKFDTCKEFINNNKYEDIKLISRSFLRQRIETRFQIFLKEIGQEISYDDLATLDRMPSLQIF